MAAQSSRVMVPRLGRPPCVPSSAGGVITNKGFILGGFSAIRRFRSVTLLPYLVPTQTLTGTLSIRPACCVIGQ
jgi:hypothetical protein